MNNRFYRVVDRFQLLALLAAVYIVPTVFFIGSQNTLAYSALRMLGFSSELISTGGQNIVLLKPLLAQLLIYLGLCFWLSESLERGKFKLPETSLNSMLLVWLLWMVVTVLFVSPFWYFSLEEMGRHLSMVLLFFLVQKTITTKSRVKWLLWVLFGAIFMTNILGWLQYTGRPIYNWGREELPLVSTFGNRNFFAGFLQITVPVVFGYVLATKKLPFKIAVFLLGTSATFLLFATRNRTSFLGLIGSVVIFLVLTARFFVFGTESEIAWKKFAVATLIVIMVFLAVYYVNPGGLMDRLADAPDLHRGTQRVRWIMWTGTSRAALDRPLVGHGHGIFQLVFPNYRPTFYSRQGVSHNTRHSHNEYLEILLENGLIGLAIFLLIMIVYFTISYRFLYHSRSSFYRWLVIGLVSSAMGTLIENFASVNLRWMATTFVFWLIFALTIAVIRVACGVTGLPRKSNNSRKHAVDRSMLPPLSWKTAVHLLIFGLFIFIGYQFTHILKGDFYLGRMNRVITRARAEQPGFTWEQAREAGVQGLKHNQYMLSGLYKLGYVHLVRGDYENAKKTFGRLTDLAPNYAQVHNNKALVNGYMDRTYRKLLHFEWATSLEDNRRNHLNMAGRYMSEDGMSERALLHALYVPRIVRENIVDETHLLSGELSRRDFRKYEERIADIADNYEDFMTASEVMEDKWQENRYLNSQVALGPILTEPAGEPALSILVRQRQRGTALSPLVMLGGATRLAELPGEETATVFQHYLEFTGGWLEDNPEEPLWRLAYAHLLAQAEQPQQGLELIEEYREEWLEEPRLARAVEYVVRQAGEIETGE